MRKLIALVFHYSLNGLLADEGTEYYRFCFELLDQHGGPDNDERVTRLSPERARAHHGPRRLRGHVQEPPGGHRPPVGRAS